MPIKVISTDEQILEAIRNNWTVCRIRDELHCSFGRTRKLADANGLTVTRVLRPPRKPPLPPLQSREPSVLCEGCKREGLKVPAVYRAGIGTEAQCWYCRNGQGHPLLLRRLTGHPDAGSPSRGSRA